MISFKVEIPIITQQDFSSSDIGNLQIQILSPKWAVNVSCVAACEVEKGIAFKKSQELLISARVSGFYFYFLLCLTLFLFSSI